MMRCIRCLEAVVGAAALLILLYGCASDPMTSAGESQRISPPDGVTPAFVQLRASDLEKGGKPGGSTGGTRFASAVIGPDGGSIALGPVSLRIPKGALDAPETITIVLPVAGPLYSTFGPDGLAFNKPAQLSLDLDAVIVTGSAASLTWFWWNPASGAWEDIGANLDTSTHSLDTQISHFSTYAPGGRAGW